METDLEKQFTEDVIKIMNLLSDRYSNIIKAIPPFYSEDEMKDLPKGKIYYMNKDGEMITREVLK